MPGRIKAAKRRFPDWKSDVREPSRVQDTISTFSEKVARLEASRLLQFMTSEGWKLSWNFETDQPADEARMPDLESVEAYVLNLRFFIQDNEPSSLRNMAALYREACQVQQHQQQFMEIHKAINRELDRDVWFRFNDEAVTYHKLFQGMIYSRIAHANRKGHKLFQEFTAHPFGEMLAMNEFLRCLAMLHCALVLIRNLNRSAFPDS